MAEHGAELDYDLMTRTRFTLDDLGGALSWRALLHFAANLEPTSRLVRAMHPEIEDMAPWLDGTMVAPLVADLIDCTNYGRWEYAVSLTKKGKSKPREPKAWPRPWRKAGKGEKKIGRDPIPISEFEDWWESKG